MNSNFTEFSVIARLSELPSLMDSLAAGAAAAGIAAEAVPRLQLIAEELFVNTVRHGHGGDSEHVVRLRLGRSGDGDAAMRYEDDAPPFDLTQMAPNFASTASDGGVGVTLVRQLCKAVRYRREGRCNLVDIAL